MSEEYLGYVVDGMTFCSVCSDNKDMSYNFDMSIADPIKKHDPSWKYNPKCESCGEIIKILPIGNKINQKSKRDEK